MRIEGATPVVGPALIRLALGEREPPDFGVDRAAPPAAAPLPAVAPQPATSVQMLVALASLDPAMERRRKLAAQADKGLGLLERLHEAVARGAVAPERLRELAEWAASFSVPDDADLAPLARDVELRVRVELAKHDRTV